MQFQTRVKVERPFKSGRFSRKFCTLGFVMNRYSLLENDSDLTLELMEMTICSAALMKGLFFGRSFFHKHTTIPMPLDTVDNMNRVREERALFHEQHNSNVVNHRLQEGLAFRSNSVL